MYTSRLLLEQKSVFQVTGWFEKLNCRGESPSTRAKPVANDGGSRVILFSCRDNILPLVPHGKQKLTLCRSHDLLFLSKTATE